MNPGSKVVWTVVSVLILVAGAGLNAWILFSKYPEKQQELARAEKARGEAELKLKGPMTEVNSVTRIKADIQKFTKDLATLIKKVPNLDRSEYDKFANSLDIMRKRSGSFVWKAKWIIPRRPRPTRGLQVKTWPNQMHKVLYDMDLTGTFFELLRFVRMVEKEERYVGIESFSIIPESGGEKGSNLLTRKMDLKLFSFTYMPTKDKPLEIEIHEKKYSKTTEIPE